MKPNSFYMSTVISLAAFMFFAGMDTAQAGKPVTYGKGNSFKVRDLPPKSRLRKRLEALPKRVRKRAMKWLHTFSFPENDTEYLRVDSEGGVYYSDEILPEPVAVAPEASLAAATAIQPVDTFNLHSHQGAANVVFLDFDGHTISGTAWNSSVSTYDALPFDVDGFPDTFSSDELKRIAEIWHRVAEDLAPFNIDVTTELPASFGPTVGHVLFTKDVDANGTAMPSKGAGGIAYINVWGLENYASYYSPALVYYNNLGPNQPYYMAEAGTHEFGHNLSLSHDGTSTDDYYKGLGSGNVSWGPIMGLGYYTNVTQWSKGEYPDANNPEDDLNIIAGKLLYRDDDHAETVDRATQLLVESDGSILVSNPENDPANVEPENKGIIESRNDVDMFYFDVSTGTVNITVTPAWAAYYRSNLRGANLDIEAKLYNEAGAEIATIDPLDETSAAISASVTPGRYYLSVDGVGNTLTPYSDYGSLGEYFISGTVPPPASNDTTPPTPNPMTWNSVPAAQGKDSIAMTATTAVDDSGAVQYQFQCVAGGQGCVNSAMQTSPSYVISGLAGGTTYSFQVIGQDTAGNTTTASPISSATTAANTAPVAVNDSITIDEGSFVNISVLSNDSDADADGLVISAVDSAANGVVTINGSSLGYQANAGYNGNDSFTYTISDGFGGTATATVNVTVNPDSDGPSAMADSTSVAVGKTVSINVVANDEGQVLSVLSVTQGNRGSVVINGSSISYTAGYKLANDSFTYTVTDSTGKTSTATVSVTIKRR